MVNSSFQFILNCLRPGGYNILTNNVRCLQILTNSVFLLAAERLRPTKQSS